MLQVATDMLHLYSQRVDTYQRDARVPTGLCEHLPLHPGLRGGAGLGRGGVLRHSRQLGFLTAINQAHVESVMLLAQVECNNIDIRHSSLPEDFI